LTREPLRRNWASKVLVGQDNRQENGLEHETGQAVKQFVRVVGQKAHSVCNAVTQNCSREPKGHKQLDDFLSVVLEMVVKDI